MFYSYFKYFFKFIVFSKNRQRLLILAIAGLFLSSFSLIVLQSTMGGLQNNLMQRSKNVMGYGHLIFDKDVDQRKIQKIEEKLKEKKIDYSKELEIEMLLKNKSYLTPVIVHGIDNHGYIPKFLNTNKLNNAIIPLDIAYKVEVIPGDTIQIISPSHVDSLFDDIPRTQSLIVEKTIATEVPEVDSFHIWVRLPLLQNLVQTHGHNRIRLYTDVKKDLITELLDQDFLYKTWEEENGQLVWALNLESMIMVFLFAAMSLLVSLCITSGLLIFFNKIKNDLSSFWILGASLKKIDKSTTLFLHLLSFCSILSGLFFGIVFLLLFDKLGANIMPDVFVDRKIPVLITLKGIVVSVLVPYIISFVFINMSLKQFKNEYNLLDHVRSIS